MDKQIYFDLLKDPRWQRKRLEIMKRDNFACVMCNDKKHTLNVHHDYYIIDKAPWEYDDKDLRTLCEDCHYLISKCSSNIDPLHKVIYKNENSNGDIVYILAWPYNIDIYIKTKEGNVNHIVHFTDMYIQEISNFLEAWQKDLQTQTNIKNPS
jgi:hypothetical protein